MTSSAFSPELSRKPMLLRVGELTRRQPVAPTSDRYKLSKAWQLESKPWKTSPEIETKIKESCVRTGKFMEGISSGNLQSLILTTRSVDAERRADSGSGCRALGDEEKLGTRTR